MKNVRHILCCILAAVLLCILAAASADGSPEGYPAVRQDIDFGGMDVYFYTWWDNDSYWSDYDANYVHTEEEEALHAYRSWLQETYHVRVHMASRGDWGSIADEMISFASKNGESGKLAMFTIRGDEVMKVISAGAAAPITYDMSGGKWNKAF